MSSVRKRRILERARPVSESAVASQIADALHRLADVGELVAGGLFSIAAGMKTDKLGDQRNMTAVFMADAANRYGDVWKKLNEHQRQDLERFIANICKKK
jgi:hypothetical protein